MEIKYVALRLAIVPRFINYKLPVINIYYQKKSSMWRILWTVNEFYVYYVQTTVGKEKFIPIIVNHAEITNANCNSSSQIFAHAFRVYLNWKIIAETAGKELYGKWYDMNPYIENNMIP